MSAAAGRRAIFRESLWPMVAAPTIWALHFLACYVTGAVHCAKAASRAAELGQIRWWIAGFTVAALVGIALCAVDAVRHADFDGGDGLPHDASTVDDRRRFVSWSILLLSGLSAVGVVFAALPAVLIATCR